MTNTAAASGFFTKKPVTIQAIQWTGRNLRDVITFTDGPPDIVSTLTGMAWDNYADLVAREGLKIFTLEGRMSATAGDWIIKGVKGEHYPCKPDIFEATYSPAALAAPAQPVAPVDITLDFKMATELLEMYGGEPGLVTLQHGHERSHSGAGVYAFYSDLPEEGAGFLGAEPDNEATPAPKVEPVAPAKINRYCPAEMCLSTDQEHEPNCSNAAPKSESAGGHWGPLRDADADHGKQLQVYASKESEAPAHAGEYPKLVEAHRLGFLRAAGWAQRDDLFSDIGSPAYRKDRDHDLATLDAARGAAQAAPTDPMQWPLPCDVEVGHVTISKGCALSTLVTRMRVLYEMGVDAPARIIRAAKAAPVDADMQKDAAQPFPAIVDGLLWLCVEEHGTIKPLDGASALPVPRSWKSSMFDAARAAQGGA